MLSSIEARPEALVPMSNSPLPELRSTKAKRGIVVPECESPILMLELTKAVVRFIGVTPGNAGI